MRRLGAVVLASGFSNRFGTLNKLLAPFGNMPLIAHALSAVPKAAFEKRLVVTRSNEVARIATEYGFETLVHSLPDVCDTIRLGVEQQMQQADGCLFMVGDQPFVSAATIVSMVQAFEQEPACIVRACFDGKEGNPVLFPRALFDELARLQAGEGGSAVIRRHRELVRTVQAKRACELWDVDTQADLQRLLPYLPTQKEREQNAADW